MKCDYCGMSVDGLPHKCKFCGRIHCYKHLQPENHECKRLPQHEWPIGITKSKPVKIYEVEKGSIGESTHHKPQKKLKFSDRIKEYFLNKYKDLLGWLKRREHHPYDFQNRFNYVLTTILIFVVAVVGFSIFYSNAQKLNEINLWIIKIGGILLLISLFFATKYGWRIIKELFNLFERQINWLKYLMIILVLILLWQAYNNKTDVLNPVFEVYNKTNFSLFVPISFGNFSLDTKSYSQPNKINSDSSGSKGGWFDIPSRDVGIIEQEILVLVNEERQKYGAQALTSKSELNNYARAWSDKMISQGFFEHSDLNYYYPSIAGENIGETPIHYNVEGCGSTYSNSDMAECFVSGWIGSSGHHENMIDKRFSMTGMGVSCDSSKCRATQVFSG